MHLVDALARMQLTASGQPASSVPLVYQGKRMPLLKGPDALAARRAVASKLDHSAIRALRKPMHVDKPDWSLMQQLSDAGIGVCPTSGMPVLDPSACAPGLRTAIWRAYCGVASSVNTKQMGQTDEALDELQMRLHEHAVQLRETAPRARRLVLSDGTLTKRSRGASPASSLSDDGTDAGEPARERKLRPRRGINESDDEHKPAPMGPVAGLDDATEYYQCDHPECNGTGVAARGPRDGEHPDSMGTCSGCGAWFCNDRSQHTEVSTFFAFGTCAACATYCASCGQPDVYAGCNGPCPCLEDGFDEQSESGEDGDRQSECSEGSEAYAALEPPTAGGSELPSSDAGEPARERKLKLRRVINESDDNGAGCSDALAPPPSQPPPPSPPPSPSSRSTTSGWARHPRGDQLAQREWTVSYAPSGRYSCRACFKKIAKGSVRTGAPSMSHSATDYYHLACRRPLSKSEGGHHSAHLCHKDGAPVDGVEGLASEDQAAVSEWSAPPFQIFFRDLDGHHGTLDGVRSGDLVSVLLRRIAAKLGLRRRAHFKLLLGN